MPHLASWHVRAARSIAPHCNPLSPSFAHRQIGIAPTIPIDAAKLADIPISGEAFCRFASTDAAPKLF